jgi:TspO/MBR family
MRTVLYVVSSHLLLERQQLSMNVFHRFPTLKKPSWQPPNWLFGPVRVADLSDAFPVTPQRHSSVLPPLL